MAALSTSDLADDGLQMRIAKERQNKLFYIRYIPNAPLAMTGFRAIKLSGTSTDNRDFDLLGNGGLHEDYIVPGPSPEEDRQYETIGKTMNMVRDLCAYMDRSDGGFTFVLRTRGAAIPTDSDRSCGPMVPLQLYLPAREVSEAFDIVNVVDRIKRIFVEDIALPHFRRFAERCERSNIEPVQLELEEFDSGDDSQVTEDGTESSEDPANQRDRLPDEVIEKWLSCGSLEEAEEYIRPFLAPAAAEPSLDRKPVVNQTWGAANDNSSHITSRVPIISIGSHTDAVIDQLHLDDNLIPKLHEIPCSVRSSRWKEAILRDGWDLSESDAHSLAQAMLSDICGDLKRHYKVSEAGIRRSGCMSTLVVIILIETSLLVFLFALQNVE
ncbi:hypothetical protein GLOTRDRAFT_141640 [Gloeophyllum trabeum ATCC 11539]|uniref:Uncharacterized protein n=1 Tax=Gloeophyllum trabeum (strain ATCC 11539 / FP-39264 / Madison 617) TaxID=670483 RepID=S7PRM3_GLOTA|nr:uncharacterized protein GLOTRDRAFT_141640 [Gloeophyllum trabeum ATCC 11539]EPQ50028.1 hypothetical protein GLOTRDRAFT_141640 [Gloeophyllum trabeum ATCC 11539]